MSAEERDEDAMRLGQRVAQFRELRGMSVRKLAGAAGVSTSFVSQLENGHTNASIASLRKIATALGLAPAELLDSRVAHTRGILRAANRPHLPLIGADKYVVSLPPMRNLEVYSGNFDAGGSSGDEAYVHGNAQEIVVVTRGGITVELAGERYELDVDDSIEFLTSVPHRVFNHTDEPASILWIMSPPTPDETSPTQET